jgi:hypothetical protein
MKKNKHSTLFVFSFLFIFGAIVSCKKDYTRQDTYDNGDVTVQQAGGDKSRVKTTTEFISIAYSDLFSTPITTANLLEIQQAYDAFGDKKLIEDMIVRHFLTSTSLQIPTNTAMRADIPKFTEDAIEKLFNRKPDALEKYFIGDIIQKDTSISPTLIYYAIMTSDEYRYY